MTARHLLTLILALVVAGCGGDSSTPSTPTSSTPAAQDPRVLSCTQVSYRGATQTITCSVPGQQSQPASVQTFFPGRTDCLIATCSAGCVSAVRAGTNTGGRCQ